MWRQDGKQRSLTFVDLQSAMRFKRNVEAHGPREALAILDIVDSDAPALTLGQWMDDHVAGRTGLQGATRDKYERFAEKAFPELRDLPLAAVTEAAIGGWVQRQEAAESSGKTIQDKHAFLSGVLKAAVREGKIDRNPCEGRRLPKTLRQEMVFLSRAEFDKVHGRITQERWADLALWLVSTGMRFGEATALRAEDIDLDRAECRITRAWKHDTGRKRTIGPPKSKRSVRTISLPTQAVEVVKRRIADPTVDEVLFCNSAGTAATTQEFYNRAWLEARKVLAPRAPRVHDLRHTCASWMIGAGVPLVVVSRHLGHEDIGTTSNVYGHLDRSSYDDAAAAIGKVLG
jgi:integrase